MFFDFLKLVFYRGCAALGTLLFTLYVHTYSEPSAASIIFTFILLLYLWSMIAKFGLDQIILKELPSLNDFSKIKLLSDILRIVFVICILASSINLALYLVLDLESAKWVCLNIIPFVFLQIFSAFYRAKEKKFISSVVEPGSLFFVSTLIICFFDSKYVLIVFSLVNWLFLFLFSFKLHHENSYINNEICGKKQLNLIRKSIGFMVLSIIAYLTLWFPAFFIQMKSEIMFNDYNMAVRLLAPITFIITTADLYLATKFSIAFKLDGHDLIHRLIRKFRVFFVIAGGAYLMVSSIIIYWLHYKEYFFNDNVFVFYLALYLGYFLSSVVGPFGILFSMTGRVLKVNVATILSCIFIFVLILPVFNYFGVIGVVYLTALSIIFRNLLMMFYFYRTQIKNVNDV